MAVLAIGLAGAAIGSTVGMTSLGFSLATAVGGLLLAGNQSNSAPTAQDGGLRLNDNLLQSSSYGAIMPAGYGVYRASGNVIWSSQITEQVERILVGQAQGGKGGGGGGSKPIYRERRFYQASVAISLGEVPPHRLRDEPFVTTEESDSGGEDINITERREFVGVRRLWLNGSLMLDFRTNQDEPPPTVNYVIYLGAEDQVADPTIASFEDVGDVPGYRGILYVVLPDLDLSQFGNVLPTASAEIYERLDRIDNLEEGCEGMCRDTDGDLWVCSHTNRVIQRVDPNTFEVKARIGRDDAPDDQYLGNLPAHPWRCAPSPDGNYIWVTHKAWNTITRIDRSDNSYQSFTTFKFGMDVSVDVNNDVWVTYPFENLIRKFNTSGVVLATVSIADAPWTCSYDFERGDLWVGGTRRMHRVDVTTNAVVANINTRRFYHSDMAFGTKSSDMLVTCSGDDQAAIIQRFNNSLRRYRNTGTFPLGADLALDDQFATYWVSTFSGNRVRAYSPRLRGQFNAGTIAFPGQVVAYPDGIAFVANTKLGIVQRIEGA